MDEAACVSEAGWGEKRFCWGQTHGLVTEHARQGGWGRQVGIEERPFRQAR